MHGILFLGPIGEYRHEEHKTSFSVFAGAIECGCGWCWLETSTLAAACPCGIFGNDDDDDDDGDNAFVFAFSPGDACAVTLAVLFVRVCETVAFVVSADDDGNVEAKPRVERALLSCMESLLALVVAAFDDSS
jgi:hypothetical protein